MEINWPILFGQSVPVDVQKLINLHVACNTEPLNYVFLQNSFSESYILLLNFLLNFSYVVCTFSFPILSFLYHGLACQSRRKVGRKIVVCLHSVSERTVGKNGRFYLTKSMLI